MDQQDEDLENVQFQRGANDALRGREFDPSYWGYHRWGKMEYDYARGYASENDVFAATSTVEEYERNTSYPAQRTPVYEDDGNILRSGRR